MSKAKLKKTLKQLEKEEIIEMVSELYDARKDAREYLEYWMEPDAEKELESRETAVRRLFFTSSDKPRKLPSVTSIRQVVKDFASICFDAEKVAALHLYVCDSYAAWMKAKRFGQGAVTAAEKYIASTRQYIEANGLEERYGLRLENVSELIDELARAEREAPMRRRRGWGWRW